MCKNACVQKCITKLLKKEALADSDQLTTEVQFSRSVVSCTLRPHGLQHTRPPCPSSTSRVYPNSCSSSRWCHPTISSSVVPFFSCLLSFPASESSQISQLSTSDGQYRSFSFNISPSSEHSGLISFRMDWLVLYIKFSFILYICKLLSLHIMFYIICLSFIFYTYI